MTVPRPGDSKRRSIAAIVAALLLIAAAAPPARAQAAAPLPAEEEYVLQMPGVQGADEPPPGAAEPGPAAESERERPGVLSANEPPPSPIGVAGDLPSSQPAVPIGVLLCVAAALALVARTRLVRTASLAAALAALGIAAAAIPGCGDGGEGAADRPPDFFGVAPQGQLNDGDYARMAAGGIDVYHLLLSWPAVERHQGRYDWSRYDGIVSRLAIAGIDPLPYAFGTAPGYGDEVIDAPASGPALRGWSRFLRAAAARYGPDGDFWPVFERAHPDVTPRPFRVWEIWNEPNSSVFWAPRPDPEAYASLLVRSARALHAIDRSAQVMSGGMFATPQSAGAIRSFDFLREIYSRPGVADVIDIVGLHPYGPDVDAVVEQVERTRQVVDEAGGDDAALWVTEVGWGSRPSRSTHLATTPERQAELLDGTLSTLLEHRGDWDLRGVIWFTWHDAKIPGNPCGWCASAGLVDQDRDAKPAWHAFTALTGGTP